jgi:hypothetical protein
MARLVSVTVTVLVDEDVDTGSLADVLYGAAERPVREWAGVNGWSAELLDADVTLNVDAEENGVDVDFA